MTTIKTEVELIDIQLTSIEHAIWIMRTNLNRIREMVQ